ncbi:MAG: hypothetical protein JSR59_09425 [Proteobacteria bacterium]|nr:hypothetical protein [Pseudomonadota bacterium]
MISRLTAYATLFAVLATTTIAIATAAPAAKATTVVQLPTVVVTGHRIAQH